MNLEKLNKLDTPELEAAFQKCCNAQKWYKGLALQAPYYSEEDLYKKSNKAWAGCVEKDFLEAFLAHPKIGDVSTLAKKFKETKAWAGNEQSGMDTATMDVIERLAKGNTDYEEKFGFIFIVCATGKTAAEMLALLEARIGNDRAKELLIAAGEQHKITHIRLRKLV
ncbi:MAG: 2-oxo-4-hydroxy-4-carboxy-5-ureidoimidazoline decarboxylase [Aureispira sp.]|nr:2-oxo-4-hydroxy-4-carboxy-5-ureidoimidazoline decarboxylase [Aureispira sp.]